MAALDEYVKEIVDKKHHLTTGNIRDLRDVCISHAEGLGDADSLEALDSLDSSDSSEGQSSSNSLIQLGATLKKLTRMANRLHDNAISSKTGDDIKAAVTSLKQVMDISIKYADKINASDRAIKIENALVSCLDKYCEQHSMPELKSMFMEFLREELS